MLFSLFLLLNKQFFICFYVSFPYIFHYSLLTWILQSSFVYAFHIILVILIAFILDSILKYDMMNATEMK